MSAINKNSNNLTIPGYNHNPSGSFCFYARIENPDLAGMLKGASGCGALHSTITVLGEGEEIMVSLELNSRRNRS